MTPRGFYLPYIFRTLNGPEVCEIPLGANKERKLVFSIQFFDWWSSAMCSYGLRPLLLSYLRAHLSLIPHFLSFPLLFFSPSEQLRGRKTLPFSNRFIDQADLAKPRRYWKLCHACSSTFCACMLQRASHLVWNILTEYSHRIFASLHFQSPHSHLWYATSSRDFRRCRHFHHFTNYNSSRSSSWCV